MSTCPKLDAGRPPRWPQHGPDTWLSQSFTKRECMQRGPTLFITVSRNLGHGGLRDVHPLDHGGLRDVQPGWASPARVLLQTNWEAWVPCPVCLSKGDWSGVRVQMVWYAGQNGERWYPVLCAFPKRSGVRVRAEMWCNALADSASFSVCSPRNWSRRLKRTASKVPASWYGHDSF